MKKMIYLMTAVIVAMTFFACTDDDNTSNASGRAVITVNTVAIYEEVGLAEAIESSQPDLMSITDTLLIYDQNGHLVNKLGTVTKSLEPQTFEVDNLPNGTYTLVAWQSGYTNDEATADRHFVLADQEELSTVKLVQLDFINNVACANGLVSATVTVEGNTFEATVTPKLVGSFVNLKSEKALQEYGIEQIALYRMDQVTRGLYLDPARTEDDRWIMEPIAEDPLPFAYIAPNELEYQHYTLEHGDDVVFSLVTWTPVGNDYVPNEIVAQGHHKLPNGSRMTYYFDVDRVSYQPPFFGPADQLSAWKADRDAGILVNDPYLKWGGNLAEVEAHIKAKQFWAEGNYHPEFWEGNGWHRWYHIASKFTEQYLFETEDGQNLTSMVCICYDPSLPIDMFNKSLLLQGYTYLGKLHYPDTEDYDDLFLSADEKTGVLVYPNSYGGWVMDYAPFDPDDLDYVIPASQAPASSKSRSNASGKRLSSRPSATTHSGFMRPAKPMNR